MARVGGPTEGLVARLAHAGGDFFAMPRSEWDPETLEERPWDVARTRKAFAQANERWRAEAQKQ